MKKLLAIVVLLSITIPMSIHAQDIIIKKNGEEIKAKVQEVGITEIKYKLHEHQNGPLYSVNKSDLFMIKYENGMKEVISQVSGESIPQVPSTEDMYSKGRQDANQYYTKYKGAGTGTFVASLLGGPITGLIPTIACSSSEPQYDNLGYPSADLMKNMEYARGYTGAAKQKKSRKVWGNFASGSFICFVVYILASSGG